MHKRSFGWIAREIHNEINQSKVPTYVPLKASILIHTNVLRVCGVFFISNLFIMPFAFIGLAQIIHFPSMDAANNEILDRVRFFLPL